MITCNFDFTTFYKRRKEFDLAPTKKPSAQWLTWLIGFAEGDGSFIVTNRGDLMFVITQSNYNIEILHEIQQGLEVGRVIIQSKALNASRYIVQDQIGLSLIVSLFNGNLVLPSRQIGFAKFITAYNDLIDKPRIRARIRVIPKIQLINKTPTFSLNDYWLVGFSDSEACFHARFRKTNYRFEYSVSQKHNANKKVLEHIQQLFNAGVVRPHNQPGHWSYYTVNISSCDIIVNYFTKFPLKTNKKLSFKKWKIIYEAIKNKQHLTFARSQRQGYLSKENN
uniref:Laglidadg endonuclease n=1 Tax=Ulva flexuosa TaxID=83791 RepID=A0A247ZKZ1_9CHLO|nr:laglidadg endonuclease [Ulva flexuosa]AQS79855.1 laglidadg endonuclease [Ulva flexuosa]ATP01413.1 hypothetical protein [Ulva flexuosa]